MMGAQLVSRVYVSWGHLADRPFRLLAHMALVVKDATEEPTYWGGRDAMAQALGLDPTPAAHQSVKRAMRAIVAAGAAKVVLYGHAGKRTEYLLTLDPQAVDARPKGVTQRPAEGVTKRPARGSLSDPAGGHSPTPLGTTLGSNQENGEEEGSVPEVSTDRAGWQPPKASESRLALVRAAADARKGKAS